MDDLISRQTAIDALDTIGHIATMSDGDKCIRVSAVNYVLMNLPSAQPQRPTGKWIYNPKMGAYVCNQCREPCGGYVMMKPRDRFCKWCGVKLEGTE